ncbi:MAG: 3-isopropylmalate dehydratase small subunit [Candidatus Dadabacteria bacterium]|nr:3-isopropylmalate dehydratase small subunit [Candidatus Dadabacteria bacterium]NIT13699.1 3-isopropylmalate dehydratase small subunit [Candidatus Dadabacteria bacterium]
MEPFKNFKGLVAPLDRMNVDTDQIIPKQFLKRIERTGFGEFLFYDWRYLDDGKPNPDFILNKKGYKNSQILLAKDNFGSGSSREHAPWSLEDYGFKVIIAPSFADIFYNNCFKNGMLPIRLPAETVDYLFEQAFGRSGYMLEIDLKEQTIKDDYGFTASFEIDQFKKKTLLEGLDDIALTLRLEDQISEFEKGYKV